MLVRVGSRGSRLALTRASASPTRCAGGSGSRSCRSRLRAIDRTASSGGSGDRGVFVGSWRGAARWPIDVAVHSVKDRVGDRAGVVVGAYRQHDHRDASADIELGPACGSAPLRGSAGLSCSPSSRALGRAAALRWMDACASAASGGLDAVVLSSCDLELLGLAHEAGGASSRGAAARRRAGRARAPGAGRRGGPGCPGRRPGDAAAGRSGTSMRHARRRRCPCAGGCVSRRRRAHGARRGSGRPLDPARSRERPGGGRRRVGRVCARIGAVSGYRFITFLTDFELRDDFVGTCHGVIKRIAPDVQVIDITHGIAPQAVLQGALVLANAVPYMPLGVHLAVVDPGVWGAPPALADEAGRLYVGPDNGLLVPAAERAGIAAAHESARSTRSSISRTFHGRDLVPAAAHLAPGSQSQLRPPRSGGARPARLARAGDRRGGAPQRDDSLRGQLRQPRAQRRASSRSRSGSCRVRASSWSAAASASTRSPCAFADRAGDLILFEDGFAETCRLRSPAVRRNAAGPAGAVDDQRRHA